MHEPVTREFELPDEAATVALGRALARARPDDVAGCLVTLAGDLGAGKTTLVRAFLEALGHEGAVPSPTYTLVEPYEVLSVPVYHVDLYRISDAPEVEFLGWHELREGLVLVEWPDRAGALTGSADVALALDYDGTGRIARLTGRGARGAAWVTATALPLGP